LLANLVLGKTPV